jgi:hypothetical protein
MSVSTEFFAGEHLSFSFARINPGNDPVLAEVARTDADGFQRRATTP